MGWEVFVTPLLACKTLFEHCRANGNRTLDKKVNRPELQEVAP
jgi:hypothetical protein